MNNTILGLGVVGLALPFSPAMSQQSASPLSTTQAHHHDHKHGQGKHGHEWLSYDAEANVVTFKLLAGYPGKHSRLNFNGHRNGKATLVVPAKSTVVLDFVNQDSLPHSAAVIGGADPIPSRVERPAIAQAASKNLSEGLPLHGEDVIRFTTPASGSYRIASGVPGQARSGMWIGLKVDPKAKAPAWLHSK